MGYKMKFLRTIVLLAFVFVLGIGIAASEYEEEVIPEYIVIHEDVENINEYDELCSYEVVFRDMLQECNPEAFNASGIKSTTKIDSEYGPVDDYVYYLFNDGGELTVRSRLELSYGNKNREIYDQLLLAYVERERIPLESRDGNTLSKESSLEICQNILTMLDIDDLVVDMIVSLPGDYLMELTDDMLDHLGEEHVKHFTSFGADTDAYYFTYRYELDGIPSVGTPQATFVVTKDGVAMMEVSHIIDKIKVSYREPTSTSWHDAIRYFSKAHGMNPNYEVSYEVETVKMALYYDLPDGLHSLDALLYPGWYIEYTEGKGFMTGTSYQKRKEIFAVKDGSIARVW